MITKTLQANADPRKNLLLSLLEADDYEFLMAQSKLVLMPLRRRPYNQDGLVNAVYFPLTCMFSMLVSGSAKEPRLEVVTIGREGVLGGSEALQLQASLGTTLVQIPGTAIRIPAAAFLEGTIRPRMEQLFHLHLYAMTRSILKGAACNHLHTMEERCARWLLITHDAADGDTFPLTQEFLSHMLGVRRATVNDAIGGLRRAAFITFVRGKLTILDRTGLEAASCACYKTSKLEYASVMDIRRNGRG